MYVSTKLFKKCGGGSACGTVRAVNSYMQALKRAVCRAFKVTDIVVRGALGIRKLTDITSKRLCVFGILVDYKLLYPFLNKIRSLKPFPLKILMPLNSAGLCDADIITPASALYLPTR